MNFSEILTQRRKSLGLSQESLAEKIQVSRQAVSKWETGEAMPDMAKLIALADALEISIDALCGRSTASSSITTINPPVKSSFKRFIPILCIILAVILLCPVIILLLNFAVVNPSDAAIETHPLLLADIPALPDTVTVSGVTFLNNGSGSLSYSFVPSVAGDGYAYEISFSQTGGQPQVFVTSCDGGVCSGTVVLKNYHSIFNVSAVISNGSDSRAVPLATNLNLSSHSGVSWLPVE